MSPDAERAETAVRESCRATFAGTRRACRMIHSRSETVTFVAPFTLPGLDWSYPAGRYVVNTHEQLRPELYSVRPDRNRHHARLEAMTQAWPVDPADPAAALANEATNSRP